MFVHIDRHLASTPTVRVIASSVMAAERRCGDAGISSTALARETIDVLIFVSVVDLLLLALRFDVNRRGLLQVKDVTDHKQIGEQQESMTMFFIPRVWRESVDEGFFGRAGGPRAISRHRRVMTGR